MLKCWVSDIHAALTKCFHGMVEEFKCAIEMSRFIESIHLLLGVLSGITGLKKGVFT